MQRRDRLARDADYPWGVSSGRGRILADRANAWLNGAGAPVERGKFVCPLCLRLLPIEAATQGHYPAEALPGRHSTALSCAECNSVIGGTYEPHAVDFLTHMFTIVMSLPGTGPLSVRGTVSNDETGAVRMALVSRTRTGAVTAALKRLRAQSSRPDMMAIDLKRPPETALRRAVLAWSFLAWVHYAGYRYAATPGAHAVRRLIIQPGNDLPNGCVFVRDGSEITLTKPTETMVVRAESLHQTEDIEEWLGIGVNWGSITAVLPFANDAHQAAWTRIGTEVERNRLQHVREVPLRTFATTGVLGKGIDAAFKVLVDGRPYDITGALDHAALVAMAAGRSPFLLVPDRSGWSARHVVTHELIAVADAESAWEAAGSGGRG